jgi:hypothetical protein
MAILSKILKMITCMLMALTNKGRLAVPIILASFTKYAIPAFSAITIGVTGNFVYDYVKPKEGKTELKQVLPEDKNQQLNPIGNFSAQEPIPRQPDNSAEPVVSVKAPVIASKSPSLKEEHSSQKTALISRNEVLLKQTNKPATPQVIPPLAVLDSKPQNDAVSTKVVPLVRPELPTKAFPKASSLEQLADWISGPLFRSQVQLIPQLSMWITKQDDQFIAHFNDDLDLRCAVQFDSAGDPKKLVGCRFFYPNSLTIVEDSSVLSCNYFKEKIVCGGSIRLSNGAMNFPHSFTIVRSLIK